MLQQRQRARRQHRAGRVVASGNELNEESGEVDIAHQVAVELVAEQHVGEVALRPGFTSRRRELHGVHRHLNRSRAALLPVGNVGVLASAVSLGHRMDQRPVVGRQPHQLAEDLARQMGAHIVDELKLRALFVGAVEDRGDDLAHSTLEFSDDAGLELCSERFAIRGMPRRVHRQQHVAHVLESDRIQVFDDHSTFGRTEHVAVL